MPGWLKKKANAGLLLLFVSAVVSLLLSNLFLDLLSAEHSAAKHTPPLPGEAWASKLSEIRCNIEQRDRLEETEFEADYWLKKPVIVTSRYERNLSFLAVTAEEIFLQRFGNMSFLARDFLSEQHQGGPSRQISLRDYLEMKRNQKTWWSSRGLYFVGGTTDFGWRELLDMYSPPPLMMLIIELFNSRDSLNLKDPLNLMLAVAPSGSGAVFHKHQTAVSNQIRGRKLWIMYPPQQSRPGPEAVDFHIWLSSDFLQMDRSASLRPLSCIAHPGDIVHVPENWWHATVNLDVWNVAMTGTPGNTNKGKSPYVYAKKEN